MLKLNLFLFYILWTLTNSSLISTNDLKIDLNDIKKWASDFQNRQIALINSFGCVNRIQSNYETKANIIKIEEKETLLNTVEGINKLFTNKNKTLHTLVDAAQHHARIYSQQVFNRTKDESKNETNSEIDSNHSLNVTDSPANDRTTKENFFTNKTKVDHLSTYYRAVESPENRNNQTTEFGLNEVYETEYRQATTTSSSSDEVAEDPGELMNNDGDRFRIDDEIQSLFISEEETMQNQLEIDKKINESLNRANYLTTTPKTIDDSELKATNEVLDSEIDEDRNVSESDVKVNDSRTEDEDDFLYFFDTKKIHSPDKPLSNLSIPRQIPEDLSELGEDEQKEYKERWKMWTPLRTINHGLFPNYRLNFSASGLHVPLNVYPQQEAIKHAIKWSDRLDETFKKNRLSDPYLSFQFFCSNDGFLRIYPLPKWRIPDLFSDFKDFLTDDQVEQYQIENRTVDSYEEQIDDSEKDENDPSRALDLYDCRLRDWYIKAASAPKDVIVLMDSSGSMRGERSIIAENVLINILDTLTENDYVSMLRFNNQTHPIDECFKTDFVQANKRNVEKMKTKILDLGHEDNLEKAELVANYSTIITNAFQILKKQKNGSNCNKVMMLVTDGDLDNLDDLFDHLNKDGSVRVFTYLVGSDVINSPNTESIACKNSGYFTHLKDLAEVKEEVQLYVPVLSRSIGLRFFDPDARLATTFSSIYADQVLLSLTDMTWEKYENKVLYKSEFKTDVDKVEPELMITMSMPVFNITSGTHSSWDMLGVAGLDIPIDEILNEIPFYRLGVNSHAFILNNNGFLVYHPDMRPLYKGFLKNSYTSLDILEVELVDDDKRARDENKILLDIRKSMIDQVEGCSKLDNKFHYNSMTRISTRAMNICWMPIPDTLFSIAISIPWSYGSYNVNTSFEIEKNVEYSKFFDLEDSEWYVHPKWTYCWDNLYNPEVDRPGREEKILLEMTPKEIIEHFLQANQLKSSSFTLVDYLFNEEEEHLDSKFFCNKELLSALVFDANATRVRLGSCAGKLNTQIDLRPINAFISTRSGLTRYFDFNTIENVNNPIANEFLRELSIDESIYKRSVDYAVKYDANHFIFQLEKSTNQTFITVSRALFLTNMERRKKSTQKREKLDKIRTPYAVIGMQFDYESFLNSIKKPEFTKQSTRIYFVDDNGYVLFAYNTAIDGESKLIKDTSNGRSAGLLLGEYDGDLFEHLVNQMKLYRRITIFDYQAICEVKKEKDEASSFSFTVQPTLIKFIFKSLFTLINESILLAYLTLGSLVRPIAGVDEDSDYYVAAPPNRTQIVSCRKDFFFYELNKSTVSKEPEVSKFGRGEYNEFETFIIYKIPKTNLILVITSGEYEPVPKNYSPSTDIEKENCDRDTFHRRAPYMYKGPVCYPNAQEKNIQACGSVSFATTLYLNKYFLYLISVFSFSLHHLFYLLNV